MLMLGLLAWVVSCRKKSHEMMRGNVRLLNESTECFFFCIYPVQVAIGNEKEKNTAWS